MQADLAKQLQECKQKTKLLEEREAYLIRELRRIVDETLYGVAPVRDKVFVSYCHRDMNWWSLLKTILNPVIRDGTIDIWDDIVIEPGKLWREEIEAALKRAKVAVLLISPDYLASQFIMDVELPSLLKPQKPPTVIWFPVRDSLVSETKISRFQAAIDPQTPLNRMTQAEQESALVYIARKIAEAYKEGEGGLRGCSHAGHVRRC